MRYSLRVKPISYLKANAAEVLTHLAEQREPLVITQNDEAKAALQMSRHLRKPRGRWRCSRCWLLAVRTWRQAGSSLWPAWWRVCA